MTVQITPSGATGAFRRHVSVAYGQAVRSAGRRRFADRTAVQPANRVLMYRGIAVWRMNAAVPRRNVQIPGRLVTHKRAAVVYGGHSRFVQATLRAIRPEQPVVHA